MMNGKIVVVGTGPGSEAYLSLRALEVLRECDVVVGYRTYVNLLGKLIEGKEVVASGMRREVERCTEVIALAKAGKNVCLISSGDPGVYGMAGIMLEMVEKSGELLDVEIVPGITSALSSASLAGAPLMNDFAVISLSDLMTPWEVIVQRISAAAQGDFVLCIYNPKSRERAWQIEAFTELVLQHRGPDTPVALVRNAMRTGSAVTLTTLGAMLCYPIDMTTTVIVGNTQTYVSGGKMITPRGYRL